MKFIIEIIEAKNGFVIYPWCELEKAHVVSTTFKRVVPRKIGQAILDLLREASPSKKIVSLERMVEK